MNENRGSFIFTDQRYTHKTQETKKMMRPLVIGMLGGITVLVTALSGCGSDSAGVAGPNYTAAAGTIDNATAAATINSMFTAINLNLTGKPNFIPGSSVRGEGGLYKDCSTVTPPNPQEDLDKDGIVTKEIVYNCPAVTHGNITLNLTGTESHKDADDSVATGKGAGYEYAFNVTGGHSQGESYSNKGTWKMSRDATTKASVHAGDWKGSGSNTDQNTGGTDSYEYGSTYAHTVTPDDPSDEWKSGKVEFTGFFGSKRTGSTNKNAPDHSYVAKYSSENLTYKTGCARFYNTGKATFESPQGKVVMTFNCNSASAVDGDGKAIAGFN